MKRFILAASAGLLAVAMASPSTAADMPRSYEGPVVPYVAPFSWTGFYVGINGGYGFGSSDWSSAITTGSTDPSGGLIGGTIGYNLQSGNWVWGFEGDIDYTWLEGTDNAGTGLCTGVGCRTEVPWLATFRGRIGWTFGQWMPYVTGGGAVASVKMTPAFGAEASDSPFGWTLGVGIEYAMLGGWSVKAEYLYADFGDSTCEAATCGVDTTVDLTTNLVRFGVNYRF